MSDPLSISPDLPYYLDMVETFTRSLATWVLRAMGWKIARGEIAQATQQAVVVCAPHTSNWDYPISMLVSAALGLRIRFLGKRELFFWPLGWLMRATGGIAVNRSKSGNKVSELAKLFEDGQALRILIPVEGTRKKVAGWKSGFYHVAQEAQVPLLLAYLDYSKKEAGFFGVFQPTGDYESDLALIQAPYRSVRGKVPDDFGIDRAA